MAPADIASIAFSTQRSCTFFLDGDDALVRPMISWQDQRAVAELNAARAALLKAAAAADAPATRGAAEEYHRVLEQVRSAVAALKNYVDPAEFQRCLQELFMPHTEAELSSVAIQESLLGILPRVSVLPEETWP